MIVLAVEESLDPDLVADLLKEAGFKVIDVPPAVTVVLDRLLDGSLKRTSERDASPKKGEPLQVASTQPT
jgi:hypothetical protein